MVTKQFESKEHRAKILDRIQKLLNVANGTQYEAEAQTAMRMAQGYMESYGVSLTDVELAKELEQEIVEIELTEHCCRKQPERWSVLLAVAVGEVFDCKVLRRRTTRKSSHLVFVGYKDDADMAKLVYVTLYISIRAIACKSIDTAGIPRLSFMYGVAERLNERAKTEKKRSTKEPSGRYALVVRSKEQNISDYLRPKGIKSEKRSRGITIDPLSYYLGKKAGDKLDLMSREKVTKQPAGAIGYNK